MSNSGTSKGNVGRVGLGDLKGLREHHRSLASSSDTAGNRCIIQGLREKQKASRDSAKFFKNPFLTLYYFLVHVVPTKIGQGLGFVRSHYLWALAILSLIGTIAGLNLVENPAQQAIQFTEFLKICGWWVLLGVLSSIGLGTGLHTFVLYLGPFIASTTLAITECNTLDVDRYGPNKFICPTTADPTAPHPPILQIWGLVALEALLWGAGTAIGELPPYFVARAAKLAGDRLQELEDEKDAISQDQSFLGRLKQMAVSRLGNIGFFGIMLFASIPNPLFDLAGLTCGHMLIPFTTFFFATLIGKAVIKANLQAFFVIIMFSKEHLVTLISLIDRFLPFLSGKANETFENVRKQYHRQPGEATATPQKNTLALLWDVFLAVMIMYFIISIIDSSVQEHLAVLHEQELQQAAGKPKPADSPKPKKDTKKVK